jgi:DNA-binding XRE family transcriptional regulator
MRLADWLRAHGKTQAMFAGSVNASQSYIADLCAGHKRPSLKLAQRIAAVTNGQVMPEDFFPKAAE